MGLEYGRKAGFGEERGTVLSDSTKARIFLIRLNIISSGKKLGVNVKGNILSEMFPILQP
jgi:hypothetical protein